MQSSNLHKLESAHGVNVCKRLFTSYIEISSKLLVETVDVIDVFLLEIVLYNCQIDLTDRELNLLQHPRILLHHTDFPPPVVIPDMSHEADANFENDSYNNLISKSSIRRQAQIPYKRSQFIPIPFGYWKQFLCIFEYCNCSVIILLNGVIVSLQ